jgi:hypothetical protein
LTGKDIQLYNDKEAAMQVQDKTKEMLIRELAELRQRFQVLEEKISKQNTDIKQKELFKSQKMTEKKAWRLPGYWY